MRNNLPEGYRFEEDPGRIEKSEWERFVREHPSGSVFQSPDMYELAFRARGMKPLALFCIDSRGSIAALCIATIIWSGGGARRFTMRSVIQGGPLVNEESLEVAGGFIKKLVSMHPGGVIYIQVRNSAPTGNLEQYFREQGFELTGHLNFIFDLSKGREQLWNSLHPTRRKQVRRSMRRGVTTTVHNEITGQMVGSCYSLLKETYRRIGLPLPGIDYFMQAAVLLAPGGILRLITASSGDKIIGFRLFLDYNGILYDWYAAGDQAENDKYPNDILPWALLEWGAANGALKFDFGGAGHPDERYGVRDFKEKFGGELVNYGRYTRVLRPAAYAMGKMVVSMRKKRTK